MTRRFFLGAAVAALLSGCFPHHERPPRADVAAISDLHLGDPRSILDDAAGRGVLLDAVALACRERGVRTLVLDGDVLELALASEEAAFARARDLFRDLNRVRGLERVVVVIGNHDHRVFEEISEPMPDKLNKEFDEGTRFHREIAEVTDRLRVTLVYPDWVLPVRGGNVRFTHGHYFDGLITPSFGGEMSLQEIEERNDEWWAFLNAGGQDRNVRAVWRTFYHYGQHFGGLLDSLLPEQEIVEPELATRAEERIAIYLTETAKDPETIAIVAGHTHSKGGLKASVLVDGRQVGVFDTGAWVVGHHDRKPMPHLFFLDSRRGEMRLEKVTVPPEVIVETRKRAFETNP